MYWYKGDIEWLEKTEIIKNNKKNVVFLGSSSFTLWSTMHDDFNSFNAINLGFGGSTLAACTWFYDRIVPRLKPDAIFVYAGDNDLGDGRTPEEVILFYYQLITTARKFDSQVPICFISIKLSPSRLRLKGSIEYANKCIHDFIAKEPKSNNLFYLDIYSKMNRKEGQIDISLFETDGLHLSRKGYLLWIEEINQKFTEIFKN